MVDFQLKLQDNKVSEWSDRYMNYAALKKLLKTAKIAEKKYIDLCLVDPLKAEQTTKAYRSGNNIVGENESFPTTLKGNKKGENTRHELSGARTSTENDDDAFSIDTKSSGGLSTIYSQDNLLSFLLRKSLIYCLDPRIHTATEINRSNNNKAPVVFPSKMRLVISQVYFQLILRAHMKGS